MTRINVTVRCHHTEHKLISALLCSNGIQLEAGNKTRHVSQVTSHSNGSHGCRLLGTPVGAPQQQSQCEEYNVAAKLTAVQQPLSEALLLRLLGSHQLLLLCLLLLEHQLLLRRRQLGDVHLPAVCQLHHAAALLRQQGLLLGEQRLLLLVLRHHATLRPRLLHHLLLLQLLRVHLVLRPRACLLRLRLATPTRLRLPLLQQRKRNVRLLHLSEHLLLCGLQLLDGLQDLLCDG